MLIRNDWESILFCKDVYRLDFSSWDHSSFEKAVNDIRPWLVEYKIDAGEYAKVSDLISAGFRIADVAIDFAREITANPLACQVIPVEPAKHDEVYELQDIAKGALLFSRFNDIVFPVDARARVYAEWLTKAVRGEFDDICLVTRNNSELSGFITCRIDYGNVCRVGLVAVKNGYRNKGIGKALLQAVEKFAVDSDCRYMNITTQYSNKSAISFYASSGYILSYVYLWLYWSLIDE